MTSFKRLSVVLRFFPVSLTGTYQVLGIDMEQVSEDTRAVWISFLSNFRFLV
jgi:hypothetical protein